MLAKPQCCSYLIGFCILFPILLTTYSSTAYES